VRGECEVDREVLVAKDSFFFTKDWICEGGLECCMFASIALSEGDVEAVIAVGGPFADLFFDLALELLLIEIGSHVVYVKFRSRDVECVGDSEISGCATRR
jgi:hypothetical protein